MIPHTKQVSLEHEHESINIPPPRNIDPKTVIGATTSSSEAIHKYLNNLELIEEERFILFNNTMRYIKKHYMQIFYIFLIITPLIVLLLWSLNPIIIACSVLVSLVLLWLSWFSTRRYYAILDWIVSH